LDREKKEHDFGAAAKAVSFLFSPPPHALSRACGAYAQI
jgi:hypothetical protein